MRLPRRSPFLGARQAELLGIYRQLYPNSPYAQDVQAETQSWAPRDRREALSVVQLWLNRSACPFAVETTAALAQSILLDQHMQQFAASASTSDARYALEQMGGGAELGIRVNYSMALIRFVNSIVDSYQTGGFAQSIAVIAQRIGLPLWFVELRHAATHEELPSLAVCREAAHYALQWLDDNFWTPQLFAGPAAIGAHAVQLEQEAQAPAVEEEDSVDEEEVRRQAEDRQRAVADVCAALKNYRDLSKRVLRDRSLANTSRDELRKYARQVGAFVHRRRSAHAAFADQVLDLGGASRTKQHDEDTAAFTASADPDDVDECTKSAFDQLVTELLKPGGLIPQTKAKRVPATTPGAEITLPAEVGAIWDPLLAYLAETFGRVFALVLVDELVRIVSYTPHEGKEEWKRKAYAHKSYRNTADAWLRHFVAAPTAPIPALSAHGTATSSGTRLVTEAEIAHRCFRNQTPALVPLLTLLCAQDPQLDERVGSLVQVLQIGQFVDHDSALPLQPAASQPQPQFDTDLDEMHERLRQLQQLEQARAPPPPAAQPEPTAHNSLPKGWRTAPPTWKPTPLGCLNGTVPNLYLDI